MTEKQEITIDNAIAKCQRIAEVASEINDAWQDIIDIFKQGAADCGYSESEDNNDGN